MQISFWILLISKETGISEKNIQFKVSEFEIFQDRIEFYSDYDQYTIINNSNKLFLEKDNLRNKIKDTIIYYKDKVEFINTYKGLLKLMQRVYDDHRIPNNLSVG